MALTAEGKQLTEAHRVGQIALAAEADAALRLLWPVLDPADLDRSEPSWMGASLAVMRPQFEQSAAMASAYTVAYREAEGVPAGPLVRPKWNARLMSENLHLAGPVRVKLLVGTGMTGAAAATAAVSKFAGIGRRGVMSGGRMMIHETSRRDTNVRGWRRVTDGNPCAFCAMLASRGPVYGKDTAISTGEGLRYHGHCGCAAELVYGEWEPSDMEQFYIDEYQRAAKEADALGLPRTSKNVLPRLRQNGTFRDSPLSRNKTSGP